VTTSTHFRGIILFSSRDSSTDLIKINVPALILVSVIEEDVFRG
jgi:hypothetical protein